jgi:GNAT superfamily N-acetyltransferase
MSTPTDDLVIREFAPSDQQAARALILAGLEEHWGELDPTLNGDLDDIAASYAEGTALVATLGDQLVGTGMLIPYHGHGKPNAVQIVRMSVARRQRRRGIGRRLLSALLESARTQGYRWAILETTSTWEDAIAFYVSAGFQVTHHAGGNTYFIKAC